MDETIRSAGVHPWGGDLPGPGDLVVGKYRIESVLGTGGMAVVFGALDITLGRPIAVKVLMPERAAREGAIARFIREARTAATIQSEHVARVFDVGTLPNGLPFIVMERLQGVDLAQLLRDRGPLPVEEACDLVLQACEALGEAHARGIVHRDLKPSNLFLAHRPDGSPCVKVLDFGIAKAVEEDAPSITATGAVMGTPLYMSPEQVLSLKVVDPRADIWALGVILFELLTCSPIFEGTSASALCAMIVSGMPIPLRARRRDAPAALEAVISYCLQKDPAGRFQDVGTFAHALAPFASGLGQASAARVSHITRSGSSRAPGPFPSPTPSAVPAPAFGPSGSQPEKGGQGALVAVIGISAGLFLLALAAGGAWWLHQRASRTAAAAPATSGTTDGGEPGATPVVVTPSAPSPSASSPSAPSDTSTAPSPPPKPSTQRDAGVIAGDAGAPAAKDAGAPKPPGPLPDKDKEEAERNAALGRAAAQQCQHHRRLMQMGDDAARKRAASTAKSLMCRGLISSKCEREVCLEACLKLQDRTCEQQIRYVIDHGPAPKY